MSSYRGKYPHHICSVACGRAPGVAWIRTNDGSAYVAYAHENEFELPRCGVPIQSIVAAPYSPLRRKG